MKRRCNLSLAILAVIGSMVGLENNAFSGLRSDFVEGLATQYGQAPANTDINEIEDWRKALGAAPEWTGYPNASNKKSVTALGGIVKYEINKKFEKKSDSTVKQILEGEAGYSPRNIEENRKLSPRNPLREAMPLNLADPSRSLFQKDRTTLRPAVVEWINVRYRNELPDLLTEHEARKFIIKKRITYQNIWFDDPIAETNYELRFDSNGLPLNPSPLVERIGIAGSGFYFRLGQNIAVDVLLTFEHEGKIFVVLTKRTDANDLAFPAGMVDLKDESRFAAAFRELGEETGIYLDFGRIGLEGKATLAWTGTVGGELRSTRHAWTDSVLYHAHFSSLAEMLHYVVRVDSEFDRAEIEKKYILNLGFIVQHYLAPRGEFSGKMFASHSKMLSFALGKFFASHPNKIGLLESIDDQNFASARMKFQDLRNQLATLQRLKK